ncbi:ATP-dependent DNA helicase RecG [Texcoconibacillus texcoconensis]|uniref:ATP-dependent DNA helicase RecG n=1 Tax=Texcoconibacillus texcoconensis TaxID=1095777 RepID=A0A840QL78_9BACI|nr:ATP-dependent DNA helicase RecG [Texcoconibacillus texcoconensis]
MNEELNIPTTTVNGIGKQKAESLKELGIETVYDLLMYVPFRYEDFSVRPLETVRHDEKATVQGKIYGEPVVRYFGKKKSRLSVRLLVGPLMVTVVAFNQAYLRDRLTPGQDVVVTGKWDQHRMTITAQYIKSDREVSDQSYLPVYPLKGNWKQQTLRRYIRLAYEQFSHLLDDTLPNQLREAYRLMSLSESLRALHFPEGEADLKQARRRMVYDELLRFQLKVQAYRKQKREEEEGKVSAGPREEMDRFISSLPFTLTNAQNRVLDEVYTDMKSPYRMNRLLQGDVGSGKTIIAAAALYATVMKGYQGALMVPTEILAEQHTTSLTELFEPLGIRVGHLSGSQTKKQKREQLERVASGEINVVVGTHALIQEGVHFHNLGLVITDEQHRFGVEQRRILREKGETPDVLFMTATPIPRTLAISAFGDMDVSVIDELPPGRKPIDTRWAKPNMLDDVLRFIRREVQKGRQAYVICPLIEESDKLDVQNAIDVHAQLQLAFQDTNVGLMHGRLGAEEKDAVMGEFVDQKVQILVSTTVVEVGVNVPNATVMVIYDAERFGLAQLHQLRGRVGRGAEQSYCVLLADPKSDVGKERMQIMTETNDGFELSERDLELRGPGDLLGKKQSGLPEFSVADLTRDQRTLEVARQDAIKLIASEAFWSREEYVPLREWLEAEGVLEQKALD